MLPPVLVVLVVGALVALELGLRRADCYAWTSLTWPAGWRKVRPARRKPSPYREGARARWLLVVEPGVPPAISIFLPPVLGVTLLWSLATALALGDLPDVARGTRSSTFVIASLSLCLIRAVAAGATLLAACERRSALFFLASVLGLALEVALACFALPCSDIRSDDVHVALAGGAAQAALTLGFAFSVWRRRGLYASAREPGSARSQRA